MEISVRVQRSGNQECWCPRTREDEHPRSNKEGKCPTFLLYSGFQWIEWCPTISVMEIFLLNLLIQILIFSGDILADTPRNSIVSHIRASFLSQSIWHRKLTITCVEWHKDLDFESGNPEIKSFHSLPRYSIPEDLPNFCEPQFPNCRGRTMVSVSDLVRLK